MVCLGEEAQALQRIRIELIGIGGEQIGTARELHRTAK